MGTQRDAHGIALDEKMELKVWPAIGTDNCGMTGYLNNYKMKILLLGEYSNVHATLARGLRVLGHEVTVASNGDFWKNYPRDIDLDRKVGKWGGVGLMAKICTVMPRLVGYDVVQLINPMFVELKAQRNMALYRLLRLMNKNIVMGAYGMDYYWVNGCCERKFLRYSDFNIGDVLRNDNDALREKRDWIGTEKERLNRYIAEDADAIVAGLYEYYACYKPLFTRKTCFIPYPIEMPHDKGIKQIENGILNIFVGINKQRSQYKGTDIMLEAAKEVVNRFPDMTKLVVAESVPFDEYKKMIDSADVLLDQLYSYTPSMNTLLAMSKGIVCVGGGERENYEIINEQHLRPIVNVEPTYQSVVHELQQLVTDHQRVMRLKHESMEYVEKHHEYVKVAKEYESVYKILKHNNKANFN